jgi:hypothetical protein
VDDELELDGDKVDWAWQGHEVLLLKQNTNKRWRSGIYEDRCTSVHCPLLT